MLKLNARVCWVQLFTVDAAPDKSCTRRVSPESVPISFPAWKEALASASIAPADRGEYQREILAFLHFCKVRRAPATVILVREYLAERERQGASRRDGG